MKLAQPAWLVLLVLLPLLAVAAVAVARTRRKQWDAFVAPRLRSSILKLGSPLPRWFSLLFLLAATATVIVALARPQGDAGTRTEKSLGRNVLVALDLSRSMRVKDVNPDRLAQAKTVIYDLLDAMPNERVGLIGFAGSAYVYAPLTVDHSAVRETVDQIDETWTTQGGSNLGSAVRLAIETLRSTGQKNNALIILSDGEHHDRGLDDMIAEAASAGVYILAVGVGTEDGGRVPHPDFPGGLVDGKGTPVMSRLKPEVMRRLAEETKGRYTVAGAGVDIPAMVKSVVKDLDAFEMEGRERRVSIEFYQWLLLPAIVFLIASLIAGTRWRGVNPAPAVGLLFLSLALASPSRADEVSAAKRALRGGDNEKAGKAFGKLAERSPLPGRAARFRLGEAAAAYQRGDFREARSAYSKALLSEEPEVLEAAHLGLGVSLFQLGWSTLAESSYPTPESGLPDMESFDALVRERFAKLLESDPGEMGAVSKPIETIVKNWTDAVRHYQTALSAGPSAPSSSNKTSARNNRDVTIAYLTRLRELMEEEIQQTEDSLPEPQQGDGEPGQPGDGEPDEPQEGDPDQKGPGKSEDEGEDGDSKEKEPKDGDKGEDDSEDPKDGDKGKEKDSDKDSSDEAPRDPNESPEDRARRLLKENADLERGPLSPGRRELRDPAKDW